tara:strand:+ start:622 stop:1224 length:603 start_codon:yes stop_codon:yes gene_type:complete
MELNELKDIWQNEQNKLLTRLEINEKRVSEITIQNSKSKIEEYMNTSILGRNLALLYAVISISLASIVRNDLLYSLPAFVAGIAMIYSFILHISLKKEDFSSMNIIELQKTINSFQIHTLKYSKFDTGIVALWFLTSIPILIKILFKFSVFSNTIALLIFIFFSVILLLKLFSLDIYKKWDLELNTAKIKLNEIQKFELE